MNFLKKGPELKKPDVKVPEFVSEAYHELRERHLLPLVVVLLVAIVAVPIALSESPEASAPPAESAEASLSSQETQVVVAKAAPGLRDYRKRLDELDSKDPFKQRFTAEDDEGEVPGEGGTPAGEGGEPGSTAPEGTLQPGESTVTRKYFTWTVDVRVVPVSANGKPSNAQPTVRRSQPELTMLPGRQTPAIVFIGPSGDGQKALMLVSSNVKGMFGDAICVLGGETCEMIALEKNVPQTFVYGGNERVFKIELLDVELTATDELRKAPLGEPKQPGGSSIEK